MKRLHILLLSSMILSHGLHGFGTLNSERTDNSERFCSVRFFSVEDLEDAKKALTRIDQSYQDELYLFNYQNLYVGQYGMRPSCLELKRDKQWFQEHGYADAYFVNYRPKQTSFKPIISPQPPQQEEIETVITDEDNASVKTMDTVDDFDLDSFYSSIPEEERPWYEEIEKRGTLGLVYNSYSSNQTDDTIAVEGNIDLKQNYEWGNIGGNIALLYDFNDDKRRYLMVNELYGKYYDENIIHEFGRTIKNWGVLEAYSISDVFNTKNFLSDSFDMSNKYGALNYEIAMDVDDSQYAFTIKFEEREQPYPAEDNVYNIFQYDKKLNTEKSRYYPSLYLRYSAYAGNDDIQGDYALILQRGYDNKRDMAQNLQGTYEQHAYLVNKAIAYGNAAFLDINLKAEAAYTDVIDYENMSDYVHAGVGLEYIPPITIGGAEIKMLAEYYRYHYLDDNKSEDVDFSEIFDNDIFIGAKSNFGDAGSSEIKGGIALDLANNEQVYALTFGTRMKQNYRLWMEWKVFVPGDEANTAISKMGQFNQVTFRASYYF